MPTALWDVRAALAAMFAAALEQRVSDGPLGNTTAPKAFVIVGSTGGDVGSDTFGLGDIDDDGCSVSQARSKVGNNWRDETGSITCAAWAWNGGSAFGPLRTTVSGIVDVIEAALQADRSLGQLLVPPGNAEFTDLRFAEQQTKKGAVVRAVFTVSYTALLTT